MSDAGAPYGAVLTRANSLVVWRATAYCWPSGPSAIGAIGVDPDSAANIAMELSLLAGLPRGLPSGLGAGWPAERGEPIGTGIKLASSLQMKSFPTRGALGAVIKPIGVRYG